MQHAIRASGVACHPAHTARFPAHKPKTATTAAVRRPMITLLLACGTQGVVSNRPRTIPERSCPFTSMQLGFQAEFIRKTAHHSDVSLGLPETRQWHPSAFRARPDAIVEHSLRQRSY